jgi:hypothetical protein
MADGFANYDRWKLMSPEDEQDERDAKRRLRQAMEDRADYEHDREKDERAERQADREALDRSCPPDLD